MMWMPPYTRHFFFKSSSTRSSNQFAQNLGLSVLFKPHLVADPVSGLSHTGCELQCLLFSLTQNDQDADACVPGVCGCGCHSVWCCWYTSTYVFVYVSYVQVWVLSVISIFEGVKILYLMQ